VYSLAASCSRPRSRLFNSSRALEASRRSASRRRHSRAAIPRLRSAIRRVPRVEERLATDASSLRITWLTAGWVDAAVPQPAKSCAPRPPPGKFRVDSVHKCLRKAAVSEQQAAISFLAAKRTTRFSAF